MPDVQGVVKLYDLTVGKYDVTCEVGPSYNTKREESAEQMMSFAQFLMTDGLMAAASPNVGDHCHQGWCKYTAQCAKRITPPAGLFFDAIKARKPAGPMRVEVPAWFKR